MIKKKFMGETIKHRQIKDIMEKFSNNVAV